MPGAEVRKGDAIMLNKFLVMFFVLILMVAAAPVAVAGQGSGGSHGHDGHGNKGGGGESSLIPLSQDEIDGLLFMREEEKVARDSYITLGGKWGLVIFDNIASSEQSHMDAVKDLIDKYGLPDPVIPGVGEFTNEELQQLYDHLMLWGREYLMDSLYVGAAIEETDMIDIQQAINLASHNDIISTYDSLMCGSRNHLRAFVRQIEANGGVYDPGDDYFENSSDYFTEIAYSPMERDCGSID